jgi:branched-chain amino acid transport system substrate-binding protein
MGMVIRRLLTATAAMVSLSWAPNTVAAEPLKIAFVETLSGMTASGGKVYQDATQISIDKLNAAGGFNGEPIELMVLDNGGNTSQTSDKVKEAIDRGAHIIVQAGASSIAGQIAEDIRKHNIRNPSKPVLALILGAEALDLTGAKCSFYAFRLTLTASMRINALLEVLRKQGKLGNRVYSINQNYSYGWDVEATTVTGASKYGYEIVGKVLHDIGKVQDFAPYAAKIKEANPDSVITGDWSTDLILLIKAARESGVRAVFGATYLDYPGMMASLGEFALGQYVVSTFNPEYENPQTVEAFKTKTGRYPTFGADLHIVSMFDLLAGAISKLSVRNAPIDTKAIALALESASLKDAMGVTTIRKEDHQAVLPVAVSVVKEGVKYPADNSKFGFASVDRISGESVLYPVQPTCKMTRPD